MRFKEILIGAAVTLAVTVIGGLLVFYFTQEKSEHRGDVLTYQIDRQVSFEGESNKLSIGALKFSNIGNEPAKNVTAIFEAEYAKIIEFNVSDANGIIISQKVSEDQKTVSLDIDNLLSEEIVSITYLLSNESSIDFNIRSERSIGKEGAIYKAEIKKPSVLNQFVSDFVPILVMIAFAPLLLFVRFLLKNASRGNTKNNIAFVLLHKGSFEDAKNILESAIFEGESGAHSLSNYAAALTVSGDQEKSEKYNSAAFFLARTKHERAVCEFNQSIIKHFEGKADESYSSLKQALTLSKSEIKLYIKNSEILNEMIQLDSKIAELVKNA